MITFKCNSIMNWCCQCCNDNIKDIAITHQWNEIQTFQFIMGPIMAKLTLMEYGYSYNIEMEKSNLLILSKTIVVTIYSEKYIKNEFYLNVSWFI